PVVPRAATPPPTPAIRDRHEEVPFLRREIAALERLLEVTPAETKDHPRVLRRLADSQSDLAAALDQSSVASRREARGIFAVNAVRARRIDGEASRDEAEAAKARARAIELYDTLSRQHPSYCHLPGLRQPADRACGDEVLYFLAVELELANRPAAASDAYQRLLRSHPGSHLAAPSKLALAERAFALARDHEGDWDEARRRYEAALADPQAPLAPYARYKLGHVAWNQGRPGEAAALFAAVLAALPEGPRSGLGRAAERDLLRAFAQGGDVAEAWRFFDALPQAPVVRWLEEVGRSLMDLGRHSQALVLYATLLERGPAAHHCAYRAAIARATSGELPDDKAAIVAALEALVASQAEVQGRSAAETASCRRDAAVLVADTAMAFHFEAVGRPDRPGTGDEATLLAARRLYEQLAAIDATASPLVAQAENAAAGLAERDGDPHACAARADAAVANAGAGPLAAEAAQQAAACWSEIVMRAGPLAEDEARAALDAFDRYACRVVPRAEASHHRVLLARARAHRRLGALDAAAESLRPLVLEGEVDDGAIARAAREQYLELMLRLEKERPACGQRLRTELPTLRQQACRGEPTKLCRELRRLERSAQKREVEGLLSHLREADDTGAATRACEGAATTWAEHGVATCAAASADCAGYAQLLDQGAAACDDAGDAARAIALREALLDPQHGLERTGAAALAPLALARDYRTLGIYAKAAHWLERFAAAGPSSHHAQALVDAATLRLGLGQEARARLDEALLDRRFAAAAPSAVVDLALAFAEHHRNGGQLGVARRDLGRTLLRTRRRDLRLRLLLELARVEAQLELEPRAARSFATAAATSVEEIRRALADLPEPESDEQLDLALDALREARFWHATRLQRDAEATPDDGERVARAARAFELVEAVPGSERSAPWLLEALAARGDLFAMHHRVTGTAASSLSAKLAYGECLEASIVHQDFGDRSSRCERWLTHHYPSEFHVVDATTFPSLKRGSGRPSSQPIERLAAP
ncbi:MAG: tetratricopeptide repeat protein, partial [Myxococcales bacterium]|nr:tetratricopeptide repeat protein [Myxococcales bacterium]